MNDAEAVARFAEFLSLFDEVVPDWLRRHSPAVAAATAFREWAFRRMAEDDFALIRKTARAAQVVQKAARRNESLPRVHLRIVIRELFKERRTRLWANEVDSPDSLARWAKYRETFSESGVVLTPSNLPELLPACVVCVDTVVGRGLFENPHGLAVGTFRPSSSYDLAQDAARHVGDWISRDQYLPASNGDVATLMVEGWTAPPLELTDDVGCAIVTSGVVLADARHIRGESAELYVIADFRQRFVREPARVSPRNVDAPSHGELPAA